jgi:hypothetical protein
MDTDAQTLEEMTEEAAIDVIVGYLTRHGIAMSVNMLYDFRKLETKGRIRIRARKEIKKAKMVFTMNAIMGDGRELIANAMSKGSRYWLRIGG